jgi:hypothetical protein
MTEVADRRLIHYGKEPLPAELVDRSAELVVHFKPSGLWVSVEGKDDWEDWCRAEGFQLDALRCRSEVVLRPKARILWVRAVKGIDGLTRELGRALCPGGDPSLGIDWPQLGEKYDGIIIAPYQWCRRLHMGTAWYYSWDCASGCIWRPRAIESVRALEPAGG